MEPLLRHRTTCRLCDRPDVELVLKLAPCPPVDAYVPKSRLHESQERFPMDLYLCRSCGHAQLLDIVSPRLLFGNYIYTTSSSPGLVDYFRGYAASVCSQLQLPSGAKSLDIGSNDGTLLRFLKGHDLQVLGVDPAREIAQATTAAGIETIPEFFTSSLAARLREERGAFDLITANNVFAHSDDLGDMAEGIRSLLSQEGVFVCEVSYLLDMVRHMVFDFIYHEHLSHHSVKPLRRFLQRHGLHLFAVEHTPSKGGTLRCFAQLAGGRRLEAPSVNEWIRAEDEAGLDRPETYRSYASRIEEAGRAVREVVRPLASDGRTIAGYGASATATVLTYQFDIGPHLRWIIDDNPLRQNLYSPGYHTPVVSSQTLLDEPTDAVIILVWRFAEMIVARNKAYLDQGGQFIVPLPKLHVLGGRATH